MSEPVVPVEDTLPEPDDVTLTEDVSLPDLDVEDGRGPGSDVEVEDFPDIDDVEDVPDIPGGDFVNRRGGLVEG